MVRSRAVSVTRHVDRIGTIRVLQRQSSASPTMQACPLLAHGA
jgi:hypothetical protein